MRRFIVLAALLAAVGCGSDETEDPTGPDGNNSEVTVFMPGFSFSPFVATIPVGGKVIFDFPAEPHNVIFDRLTGAPQDIQVVINTKVSRTFSVAGRFPYDCTIHPGMSGEVVVTKPTS
jgi:plastocyanin